MVTRTFQTSVHFYDIDLECSWFDVVSRGPCTGINLFMTRQVEPGSINTFEERVASECLVAGVGSLMIFSPFPIGIFQRLGKLCYLGTTSKDETALYLNIKKNFRNDAMPSSRTFFGLGCLLVVLGLTSCFYPETFDVPLNIDKTGAYSFAFDGTLVFLSDNQAADEALLNDQDPPKVAELEKALKKNKSFQEISYVGKGRFKVRYLQEGVIKPDAELKFLDENCLILTIEPGEPGRVIIKGAAPGTKTLAYLKKLNVNLAGKLTITTNAKVIRHNADRGPWFFGLLGPYEWQFASSPFPEPWMLLQLE